MPLVNLRSETTTTSSSASLTTFDMAKHSQKTELKGAGVHVQSLRAAAAARTVEELVGTPEGKEGLVRALKKVMAGDSTLRLQLGQLTRGEGPSNLTTIRENGL